jgi:hypothetical protein
VSDGTRWVDVKWVGKNGYLLIDNMSLMQGPNPIENFEVVERMPEFQKYKNEGKIEILPPDWMPTS